MTNKIPLFYFPSFVDRIDFHPLLFPPSLSSPHPSSRRSPPFSWAPLGYIFESPILDTLLKYFQHAPFRNVALQCLTEVAALQLDSAYDAHFLKL